MVIACSGEAFHAPVVPVVPGVVDGLPAVQDLHRGAALLGQIAGFLPIPQAHRRRVAVIDQGDVRVQQTKRLLKSHIQSRFSGIDRSLSQELNKGAVRAVFLQYQVIRCTLRVLISEGDLVSDTPHRSVGYLIPVDNGFDG